MKKLILLFYVMLLMSSCITYVKETGRFYPRRTNIRPYHRLGINGFHLKNKRYRAYLYPPENRKSK